MEKGNTRYNPGVRRPRTPDIRVCATPTYSRLNLIVYQVIVGYCPVIDGFSRLAHSVNRRSDKVAIWSVCTLKTAVQHVWQMQ